MVLQDSLARAFACRCIATVHTRQRWMAKTQKDLPVKWHFSEYKFVMKYVFQENALGMLLIQLYEIFRLRF